MVTVAILAVFAIAFTVVLSMTQSIIRDATRLLEFSEKGTAKITSKGADRSRRNSRYYINYQSVEHGTISGKAYFQLDQWDGFEVGQAIPVWYLPNDHPVSRVTKPTLQHISNAKQGQILALLTLAAGAGVFFLWLGVVVSREKRLALVGIPISGGYKLETKSAAGRTEYRCSWSFVDADGKPKEYIHKRYSPSLLPKVTDGDVTLLVDRKHPASFKAWELFKWVDILVE